MPSTVLSLQGELGLSGAPKLRESLLAAIRESRTGPLILDMADVPFIDSTGVGVILGARKRLATDGRELRLAGLQERVSRTLTIMGLHSLLPIFPTLEEARAAAD